MIPTNSIGIHYSYPRANGKFYIWEAKGGKWQWHAAGNDGEAANMNDAIRDARLWVMNGYDHNRPDLGTLHQIDRIEKESSNNAH